jgi:hypothetical protein
MPKAAQKKRQKWPFLTTAGGIVFGMAGFLPLIGRNGRQNAP